MDEREAEIRKKARGRASIVPGSGFALLGHPGLTALGYSATFLTMGAMAAVSIWPGSVTVGLLLGSVALSVLVWLAEIVAVGRIAIRSEGEPGSHPDRFAVACLVTGVFSFLTLACILLNIGSMVMAGGGMSPVVLPGERFLYHKRVEPTELVPGALVTFGVSDRSSWGRPGEIVFARILAVPGDTLAIRDGRYRVNGIEGSAVGPTGHYPITLEVPDQPGAIDVPPDCYFVVQDQASKSLDSRQFSWVRREDLISTKHRLFSARGFLRPLR